MHALCHRFTETHNFNEGEEPEVNCSSFTNTWPILISNDIITIYVPRAFQRAASHPLILQHMSPVTKLEMPNSLNVRKGPPSEISELGPPARPARLQVVRDGFPVAGGSPGDARGRSGRPCGPARHHIDRLRPPEPPKSAQIRPQSQPGGISGRKVFSRKILL